MYMAKFNRDKFVTQNSRSIDHETSMDGKNIVKEISTPISIITYGHKLSLPPHKIQLAKD